MGLLIFLTGTLVSSGLLAYSILRLTDQDALDASLLPFVDEPSYKPQILFEA